MIRLPARLNSRSFISHDHISPILVAMRGVLRKTGLMESCLPILVHLISCRCDFLENLECEVSGP